MGFGANDAAATAREATLSQTGKRLAVFNSIRQHFVETQKCRGGTSWRGGTPAGAIPRRLRSERDGDALLEGRGDANLVEFSEIRLPKLPLQRSIFSRYFKETIEDFCLKHPPEGGVEEVGNDALLFRL
jgi:hypothetical protein